MFWGTTIPFMLLPCTDKRSVSEMCLSASHFSCSNYFCVGVCASVWRHVLHQCIFISHLDQCYGYHFSLQAFSTVFNKLNLLFPQVFSSQLPDLSFQSPLIMSGRYRGKFPNTLAVTGIFPDMKNFSTELKVHEAKDIPLDKVRKIMVPCYRKLSCHAIRLCLARL